MNEDRINQFAEEFVEQVEVVSESEGRGETRKAIGVGVNFEEHKNVKLGTEATMTKSLKERNRI